MAVISRIVDEFAIWGGAAAAAAAALFAEDSRNVNTVVRQTLKLMPELKWNPEC